MPTTNPRYTKLPLKYMDEPRPKISVPSVCNGNVVSDIVNRKIRATLLSGERPQLATIARVNGVSRDYVQRMLDNDPELMSSYKTSLCVTAEKIEKAAVDMCLDDGVNPIARGKLIEFMLPKMMPEKYGEQAGLLNGSGSGVKKIAINLVMPVIEVDQDGIPISKKEPEIINVESKVRDN